MSQIDPRRRGLLVAACAAAAIPTLAFGRQETDDAAGEPGAMRIRLSFAGAAMTATLEDNPSAREFFAMLPLDLTASDFGGNEKIAYLPRKLRELTRGPFPEPRAGDLCYYVPWGNLALFHGGYQSTRDLVRLGRFDGDLRLLLIQGEHKLRVERAEQKENSHGHSPRQ